MRASVRVRASVRARARTHMLTRRELVSLLVWHCVFVSDWKPLEGGAVFVSYLDTALNIRNGF